MTVTSGFYYSDESNNNKLAKRQQDIPAACWFETGHAYHFWYFHITGIQGTACIGYLINYICDRSGVWEGQDFTDIQRSVGEQVTKDGFFKTSTVGRWTAAFLNLSKWTTAFSNRETVLFIYGLLWVDVKPQRFYWSRDGDFLQTQRDRC